MATSKKDTLSPIPETDVLHINEPNDLNAKSNLQNNSPGRLPGSMKHRSNIEHGSNEPSHQPEQQRTPTRRASINSNNRFGKNGKHEHDDKYNRTYESKMKLSPKKFNTTNDLSPSTPRSCNQRERVTFADPVNISDNSTESSNSLNSSNSNNAPANGDPMCSPNYRDDVSGMSGDQDVLNWECDHMHMGETVYRGGWGSEWDFTVSALGYIVGLGNVWRFPYLCYKNGGGAFLLPYFLFLVVAGIPLTFLEISFGQFAGVGVITAWKVLPLFKGIGYGMVIVSFLVAMYYNVILAWTLFYLFASMQTPLPWASCDNDWNTPACCKYFTRTPCSTVNASLPGNLTCLICQNINNTYYVTVDDANFTLSDIEDLNRSNIPGFNARFNFPAEEYFYNEVLNMSDSIEHLGVMQWELVLCLLLSWILVFLALFKGVRVTGKLAYFTVIAPFVVMLVILIRASMLPGASTGVVFYLHPEWDRLLDLQVWHDAASQVFFSLSVSYGGLMTLSSYNQFNHNCYKDSLFLCVMNSVSSIFAGFPAFCTLGYMARQTEVPVAEAVAPGSGLMFVAYPEALTHLPFASWWAVAFFFVLYTVGFDSQLVLVTTVITSLSDHFPRQLYHHRTLILLLTCALMFFLGLPLVTNGGLYLVEVLDNYASSWGVLWFSLLQCVGLCWIYGYQRLSGDICMMLGKRPGRYWRFMWQFVTPISIVLLLIAEQFQAVQVETDPNSHTSSWVRFVTGWSVTSLMLVWVPGYAVYFLITTPGSLKLRWRLAIQPADDWGQCSTDVDTDSDIPDYIRSEKEEYIKRLSQAHSLGIDNPALSLEETLQSLDKQVLHEYEDLVGIHTGDDIDTGSIIWSEEENKERGNWTGRFDFLLSGLAYTIGIGNVWRFPYLVYKNGGGAFFVPYFLMILFCGVPLFYLELAFGQFASTGPLSIWKVSPVFKGVGYCAVITVMFITLYYNVLNAWAIHYLMASMQSVLPWQHCNNTWNTENCHERTEFVSFNCSTTAWDNMTVEPSPTAQGVIENCSWTDSGFVTPSEEYFFNQVLGLSAGPGEIGEIRWDLALCLLLSWIVTFIALIKGVKSVGKVVYATVSFPYVILMVLLIRYVTLDAGGHMDGIRYFVTPQWEKLAHAEVWGDAASQLFFSLGLSMGSLISLSSYNRFHYDCYRDAYLICLLDTMTSIFAGFVIFAILGVMAEETNSDVESVIKEKFTLAFVVFPEAVTQLPVAPLWSILFFFMLFCLAIDSQFLMVEGIIIALMDEFGDHLRCKRIWVILGWCVVMYILGLPLVSQGGLYAVVLMDSYVASLSPLFVGILLCVALSWVYGVDYFCSNVRAMLGNEPNLWWRLMWRFVTPGILMFILIFYWIEYHAPIVQNVSLAGWPESIGLFLAVVPVLAIPIAAMVQWWLTEAGDWRLRCSYVFRPRTDWQPAVRKHQILMKSLPGYRRSSSASIETLDSVHQEFAEQSIFATQASGMFAVLAGKSQKRKRRTSKFFEHSPIRESPRPINRVTPIASHKEDEEGALIVCTRGPPAEVTDMSTQTEDDDFETSSQKTMLEDKESTSEAEALQARDLNIDTREDSPVKEPVEETEINEQFSYSVSPSRLPPNVAQVTIL